MKAQQIISTRSYNGDGDCACGAESDLFIVEYHDEIGEITGDYPSLLQCSACLSGTHS